MADDELRFRVAPGVGAAFANMNDNRAYYIFDGDLHQMGVIYTTLLNAGFPVVKNNVYPGFTESNQDEYKRALLYLFERRVEGWWNQRSKLIEYGICTQAEYMAALNRET